MVIFKLVPFWLVNNVLLGGCVDDDHVWVNGGREAVAIFMAHFVLPTVFEVVSAVVDRLNKLFCMGLVTYALEEFDAFFSLEIF